MNIEDVFTLIKGDMERVNHLIQNSLYSEVVLINQISQYIINSGGKRLRPVLVLLSANAFAYNDSASSSKDEHDVTLAAVIEFIHTATLLHDDVVDESELRRGKDTANELWGNAASVLVGDFLYSRAFEMMVGVGSMKVMEILSHSTNTIAEGEVLQLLNCNDASTTEARYIEVIHYKTAKLFESASQLGAVVAHQDDATEQAMAKFGMHLGTAFQLIDDVLDYSASSEDMGKNVGDDLAEGKPTLPLIYAMAHGTEEQAKLIREAIEQGGLEQIEAITQAIETTGALDYTRNIARKEAEQAIAQLENIPDSKYKQAMITLAHFSVERSY
ncbi:MAG: octaprenyl diphosphate synthase [gamma proteobacterium symbiont of Bathyaustriella thionipta]|nr:octaprenyl diphosphate synthase [gamma proteobacterium symbiont of Bathyaustriella thionipta]MCU7951135.1 octaprenyl diphosphate synthase [gamma proteobacterium symbiont of Bathyaustriella thionipta]MCU7954870.1 octaprenyl diphosphate synthase [gamma proteobacterium symbiont of Bathyaustriella thionipta]MCU7957650.1 octaprenyl diphosphate synthase [gamma proteobacterium symbiont of Bathyaustriella thionipta]MCU7967626.1 octaprenyl diphosphate synthase [gamma proteobacterium symbiont of Bathy